MAAAASNLLGPTEAPGRTATSWPSDIPTPGHALARGFFFFLWVVYIKAVHD